MRLIYSIFIGYILLPKIDLFEFGGSAVRVNDLIFAMAFLIYLSIREYSFPSIPFARNYLLLSAFAFFSMILNAHVAVAPILYIVRPIEYVAWAFMAYDCVQYVPRERFIRHMEYISWFLLLWALLEWQHLIPKVGKFQSEMARVTVNTSGPFEIAVIASFLVFISRERASRLGSFAIIFLSQARVTIVAALFLVSRPYWRLYVLLIAIAVPIVLMVPWSDAVSGTRFGNVPSIGQAIDSFAVAWDKVPVVSPDYYNDENGYSDLSTINDKTDASFEIRVVRWIKIVKSVFSTPTAAIFGYGPAAWGSAVDGYYVRLIGEGGLVGLFLFLWVMFKALRDPTLDLVSKEYIVCLLITATLIDIFVTDKPMSLLWFYVGYISNVRQSDAILDETESGKIGHVEATAES
jgi:hypothetical protein